MGTRQRRERQPFQDRVRFGASDRLRIAYRRRRWAVCPADKLKRAQEVLEAPPEPLNAKQRHLYDEPPEFYQSGSSRRDPPPRPGIDRPRALEADLPRSDWERPHDVSRRRRVALAARPLRRRDSPRSASRCGDGPRRREAADSDLGGRRSAPPARLARRDPLGLAGFKPTSSRSQQRFSVRPQATGVLRDPRRRQGRSSGSPSCLWDLRRPGCRRRAYLHTLRGDWSPPRLGAWLGARRDRRVPRPRNVTGLSRPTLPSCRRSVHAL